MGANKVIFDGAAWRRLSIAGELIDNLARFIPDHDDRSGFTRPAIFQKFIYYCTSGPNGGLVARHHRTARVADYPIWVGQFEEIARHATNHNAVAQKKRASAGTAHRGSIARWVFLGVRSTHPSRSLNYRSGDAQSEALLLNILPRKVAAQLKHEPHAIAELHREVTIVFADIVDFTPLSLRLHPLALVRLLNDVFSAFDELAARYGVEKIKTIGDVYMAVAGLPEPRADHAQLIADLALDMLTVVASIYHFA